MSMSAREARASDGRVERLALAAGLTTVFFWASAFVGIRAAAVELSPGALALGRLLLASAALGVTVSAAVYSVAVTIQKPLLRRASGLMVTWLACMVGTAVSLPFLPQLVDEAGRASETTLGWVVYLGIFPTAIAFSTWAYALAHTSAGRLGSLTYLAPAIAIIIGWILLGEAPAPVAFLGGAVAIGGVVIARSQPARPAPSEPATESATETVRGAA